MSRKKKSKQPPPYQQRLDPDKVQKAKDLGIDVPDLFRKTLDKALNTERCPTCRRPIKRTSRLRG